ncbi:MAG: HlyD family efflux transporter periplasmic adaptor subunit, partial [Phycisphaerae bacterium]|nr:HlyD family efflux transporter periplasmic adaptor subunit [Phycisphaerae bacterium]
MKLRIVLNIVLSIMLLAGAVLAGKWLIAKRRQPAQRVPHKVVPRVVAPPMAPRLNQRVEIIGYGSARPKIQLRITPQVTGIIVEKAPNFLSGKYVSEGQVLCRIEETDYKLAVERVEKSIELLKAQLERLNQEEKNLEESRQIETERRELARSQVAKVSRLVERNAASDNELDLARQELLSQEVRLQDIVNKLALIGPDRAKLEAEIASKKVELKQAQTNLARCILKSPVAGRVLSCNIEVGEQVQTGANCGEIYGTDIMEVPVSIAYTDLEWMDKELLELSKEVAETESGEHIEAIIEWQRPGNGQTVSWRGRIDRIEAGLEAETRMASLVVQVKNPRPNEITGGTAYNELRANKDKSMLEINMFCKVTVLGKKLPEVYILPRQAVLPDGSVYMVVDGRLAKEPVEVGRFAGEEA